MEQKTPVLPRCQKRALRQNKHTMTIGRADGLNEEHERFISEEHKELQSIRQRKLEEFKARKQMNAEPLQVTDKTFAETVNKNTLVLIDFWAPWCGPCRALAPTIVQLHKDYCGRLIVGKLNVDENPETAECYQVFSIPTLLIMKNGEEVERIVGCVPKSHIETALSKHLG